MINRSKNLRFIKVVFLFVLLSLVPRQAMAQEIDAKNFQTFTLYFENDTFFGTDYLYTSGMKLSWTSPDLEKYRDTSCIGNLAHSLIGRLPFVNEPEFRRSVSLSVGQNIYTSEDTEQLELIEDDRPYAGLTYLGVGLHGKSNLQMNTWEFILGTVGPHSYAEEAQKLIHEWKGDYVPMGWNNQLGDEPVFNVFFEHRRKILQSGIGGGWGYDLIPNLGAGLGNLYIGAHTGAQIRFGWNLSNDFGTNLIRPGSDTNAPLDKQDPRFFKPFHRLGLHIFMGVDGMYVLRNLTLDGNTFRESYSVDKEPIVGSFMAGVGFILYRFKISFAHVFQTKEFKTQKNQEEYGSITLSYSF